MPAKQNRLDDGSYSPTITDKTIADAIAERETLYVNCAHPMCSRSTKLDLQALADRLGPVEHGAMHDDLVRVFCVRCRDEGRERRPVFFTCLPDYAGDNTKRNAQWKPVFKR